MPALHAPTVLCTDDTAHATTDFHARVHALTARLQDALAGYGLRTDAHVLASGRIAVSVAPGLLVRTDGEHIWWTIREPRRTAARTAVYRTPDLPAERIAQQAAAQPPDRTVEPRDALPQ